MTIHSLTGKPPQNNPLPSKSAPTEKVQRADKQAIDDPQPTVSVDITEIAQKITQAFETSSDDLPAIDIDRVNSIKAELEKGSYTIDAVLIAEKMVQMEQKQFYDSR